MENSYEELVDNIIYVEEEPNLTNSTYTFIDFDENDEAAVESLVVVPHQIIPKQTILAKDYICGSCDDSFVHRKELDAHVQEKHPQIYNIINSYRKNEPTKEKFIQAKLPLLPFKKSSSKVVVIESCFACKCGEKFKKFLELEQHVEIEHTDEFQTVVEMEMDENPIEELKYSEEQVEDTNDMIEEDTDEKNLLVVERTSIDKRASMVVEHKVEHATTSFVTIDELISKRVTGVKTGNKVVRGNHICTYCGEKFYLKSNFLDHMRDKHPDNPEYICEICSKGFFDQYQLRKHKHVHNLKRFVCDICSKGMSLKICSFFYIKQFCFERIFHKEQIDRSFGRSLSPKHCRL